MVRQTADLWIDLPEERPVRPPVTSREQVLPLQQLRWENFEKLCYRLAFRLGDVADCRRYGVQGQSQGGIDLYVRRLSDHGYSTWQCKKYAKFSVANLKSAVTRFLNSDWAKRSSIFYLAVTVDLSDSKFADAIEQQAVRCKKRRIEFVALDNNALSMFLKEHPDLVDDFFDRPWVEAFCGRDAAQRLGRRKLTKQQRVEARRKLYDLYTAHFNVVDVGLPIAARGLREAIPNLPLQRRYVVPDVDSLASVIESTNPSYAREAFQAGNTEFSKQTSEQKQPSSLRVKEYRTKQQLFEWLVSVHRGIILGTPGLGKSAALHFLVLDLLSDAPVQEELAKKWGAYVPILIPFAALTQLVAESAVGSITDFLKSWLHKLGAPTQTIELLNQAQDDERLLLVVDGLDEWTDSIAAGSARTLILDFALSRGLPVIASARPRGYEQLGALGSEWKKAELRRFETEQQAQFAQIWFEHFHRAALANESPSLPLATLVGRQTDAFISEVRQDADLSDLAGTPLLLSALIYLRLMGRVLPHNRYEALEEITRALAQEQPRRRAQASLQGLQGTGQHSRLFERGLQFLALFIHQQPGSDSIESTEAVKALSTFFEGKDFQKPVFEAAELAAKQVESSPNEVGILVQRQPGQLGFFHRSIQEYLAAKEIVSWDFEKTKDLILHRFCESGWHETILAALHLLPRQSEVDAILAAAQALNSGPVQYHVKQVLLARAVFGDVNCSAAFAENIAEHIFGIIEESTWMPLRRSLLAEAVRGLDSEVVGVQVRIRLEKWFPGKVHWRMRLYEALAVSGSAELGSKLYYCFFNVDHEVEIKEIASAIAKHSDRWPEIGDKLAALLCESAEEELLAPVLHALCAGWPNHPQIPNFLADGSALRAGNVRFVALMHRAHRGERSDEIKRALAEYHSEGMKVYPWEENLMDTLCKYWAGDAELRRIAITSLKNRNSIMPTEWFKRYALCYLLRSCPNDDEVAELLAAMVRNDSHRDSDFEHSEMKYLLLGYKQHPSIIPPAEEWLENHARSHHSSSYVAQLAMLARTEGCKRAILGRLKSGDYFPQWTVEAALDLCGPDDPELQDAMRAFMSDANRLPSVANFLPIFIKDPNVCRDKLLSLLTAESGFDVGHVLAGLEKIGLANDPQVIATIDEKLNGEKGPSFWYHASGILIQKYSELPAVKATVLKALNGLEPSLYALAPAYSEDQNFRPLLEALLNPLHKELRLTLVQSLGALSLRIDPFAQNHLALYEQESDGGARTAAAYYYYTSCSKIDSDYEDHVARLVTEMKATGEGYQERREAAAAGLFALNRAQKLIGPVVREAGGMKLSFDSGSERNWAFVQAVVESWESIIETCGNRAWQLFQNWAELVVILERAGKRKAALQVPKNLTKDAFVNRSHNDVDVFLAREVIEEGNKSFQLFCLGLFEKLRKTQDKTNVSWGYAETEVWFEAARYLAHHYKGDVTIGHKLEDLARNSHEPTAPLIALCRGWPSSSVLRELWDSISGQPLDSDPSTAWLVSARADTKQFLAYISSLPRGLQWDSFWRFPTETIRAIRDRLSRDEEAQSLYIEHFEGLTDLDVVVSVSHLAGLELRNREPLCDWAQKQISASRKKSSLQPTAHNMISGSSRPVEFCLLEAYFRTG